MNSLNSIVLNQRSAFLNNFNIKTSLNPLQKKVTLVALTLLTAFSLLFLNRFYIKRNKQVIKKSEPILKKMKAEINTQSSSVKNQIKKDESESTPTKVSEVVKSRNEGVVKTQSEKNELEESPPKKIVENVNPVSESLKTPSLKNEFDESLSKKIEEIMNLVSKELKTQSGRDYTKTIKKVLEKIEDALLEKVKNDLIANIKKDLLDLSHSHAPTQAKFKDVPGDFQSLNFGRLNQLKDKANLDQKTMLDLIVKHYGSAAKFTVITMIESLKTHSFSLTYDDKIKQFTVVGSYPFTMTDIEKILKKKTYNVYEPKLSNDLDEKGNHKVKLIPCKEIFTFYKPKLLDTVDEHGNYKIEIIPCKSLKPNPKYGKIFPVSESLKTAVSIETMLAEKCPLFQAVDIGTADVCREPRLYTYDGDKYSMELEPRLYTPRLDTFDGGKHSVQSGLKLYGKFENGKPSVQSNLKKEPTSTQKNKGDLSKTKDNNTPKILEALNKKYNDSDSDSDFDLD